MNGNLTQAISVLEPIANDAIGALYFLGTCLGSVEREPEAIPLYERIIAAEEAIPDALMTKYGIGGIARIAITETVQVDVPISNVSAALTLAEWYQRAGRLEEAIDLLESLGEAGVEPEACALSLADLYAASGGWTEVVRVTDGFAQNEDDASLATLLYRIEALLLTGMPDGALELTKEALRSSKRQAELLIRARYLRGRCYEASGKAAMAAKEYERVYAEDARYEDVATRLGR